MVRLSTLSSLGVIVLGVPLLVLNVVLVLSDGEGTVEVVLGADT